MGEGVKEKIQNLLTRAHVRRRQLSVVFHSLEARRAGASKTANEELDCELRRAHCNDGRRTLCRLVRRAPTHIEAVRNLDCDTASILVSATKNDALQKKDVNRALCSDVHSV